MYINLLEMFGINKSSFGIFNDTIKYSENKKNDEKKQLEKLNLSEIIQVDFPSSRYYRQQTSKNQIVLHHTVSGQGVEGDIAWWKKNVSRIATAVIIDYKGDIYQCFSSKYWAHHLGIKQSVFNKYNIKNTNNVQLNKNSIGIEIDAWGGLIMSKKYWYPAKWDTNKKTYVPNKNVKPIQNVVKYPNGFRGFYGYEKYTDEQIESVRRLLVYWGDVYKIPLDYNSDMWDVSTNALKGKDGIWSHISYRDDKSDCHPQKELIEMLKSLK